MKLVLVQQQNEPPVSVEEAKAYLRVLSAEEDELIRSLILAATDRAEQITSRALRYKKFELYRDGGGALELPYPPLRAVLRVEKKEEDGWRDVEYELDDKATPALIDIDEPCDRPNGLRVIYESGYEELPAAIKSWILIRVATMFENRQLFLDATLKESPVGFVDHLLDSYRVQAI